MNKLAFRTLAGLSLAGALAAGTGLAHAQPQGQVVQARVISATPLRETTGSDVSYNVTYEYNGQRYTTRMNSRPGATIPIQASGYGVTLIPQIAADVEQRDERVKFLRMENPQPGRSIGLVFRKTSPRKADFAALGDVVKGCV